MPPEVLLVTVIAIVAGCATLITVAKMISNLIQARMNSGGNRESGSLTHSELKQLIRDVIREEQKGIHNSLDHLEALLENPKKLEARRTLLLDASLEPDHEVLEPEPARKKRELT